MYAEDDYLPLSGVQHFAYCPRQWALIHVEQAWSENERTVEGSAMHERCHDELIKERRGTLLVVRGLRISSARLGLSGVCDVVEFRHSADGVALQGEEGLWVPTPVEYKRGTSKSGPEDLVQVCAQAMCLEEMLCCHIYRGSLYYGEKRRRDIVELDDDLRNATQTCSDKMHELFVRGATPRAKCRQGCRACSLVNICMPELERVRSVSAYIADMIGSA